MNNAIVYFFPIMIRPAALFAISEAQDAGYNSFSSIKVRGVDILKVVVSNKKRLTYTP